MSPRERERILQAARERANSCAPLTASEVELLSILLAPVAGELAARQRAEGMKRAGGNPRR